MTTHYTRAQIIRRGNEIYDAELRPNLEPTHNGQFLAIDIESSDYEIDREDVAAIKRLKSRRPDAAIYIMRVGYAAAYRLGGHCLARPA